MDHLTFLVLGLCPNLMVSVNGGIFIDFRELWVVFLMSKTVLHLADRQWSISTVVKRLEHLLCEEKLKELDLAWRRDSSGGTQQLLCSTYGKSIKNMSQALY